MTSEQRDPSEGRAPKPSRADLAAFCVTFFALGVTVNVIVLEQVGSTSTTVIAALVINSATSELAYLAVRDAGGSQVAAAIAGWVVASRFGMLAASLGARLHVGRWHRAAAAVESFDPNVTLAVQQRDPVDVVRVFWRITAAMMLGWTVGTVVGVFLGNVIGDAERFGLDALFPASLLAIIAPLLRQRPGRDRRRGRRRTVPGVAPGGAGGHPDHCESRRSVRRDVGAGAGDMSWLMIVVLAVGTWGQRLAGMFVGGRVLARRPGLGRLATLIPAAVVTAVIVQLTVGDGRAIVIDARAAGMAMATFAVWRRAPFVVVVISAAATTALVRLIA